MKKRFAFLLLTPGLFGAESPALPSTNVQVQPSSLPIFRHLNAEKHFALYFSVIPSSFLKAKKIEVEICNTSPTPSVRPLESVPDDYCLLPFSILAIFLNEEGNNYDDVKMLEKRLRLKRMNKALESELFQDLTRHNQEKIISILSRLSGFFNEPYFIPLENKERFPTQLSRNTSKNTITLHPLP